MLFLLQEAVLDVRTCKEKPLFLPSTPQTTIPHSDSVLSFTVALTANTPIPRSTGCSGRWPCPLGGQDGDDVQHLWVLPKGQAQLGTCNGHHTPSSSLVSIVFSDHARTLEETEASECESPAQGLTEKWAALPSP